MTFPRRSPSISSTGKYDSFSSSTKSLASLRGSQGALNGNDPALVNAQIEAQLKHDNETLKKEESNLVKILLLGQSGSGKSTTLKNFRMQYAWEEWERERLGWRAIIQLNIIRQVLCITQILESELNHDYMPSSNNEHGQMVVGAVQTWIATPNTTSSSTNHTPYLANRRPQFTDRHRHLATRLSSQLSEVEQNLRSRLTPHDIYYPAMAAPGASVTPFGAGEELDEDMLIRRKNIEYSFKSWRDVLDVARQTLRPSDILTNSSNSLRQMEDLDIPTQALANLREEIKALWADEAVRTVVRRRRLEIPDFIGFDSDAESNFLNEIDRIARVDYCVSDQDIVRARLRTVGIQEYTFYFDSGAPTITGAKKWSWRVYDVGGCRTMRKAWLPYFDNVQVIIFLAPVSAFDERLEEDPRVNRLEDSILLWSCICETPLLAKTQIILFLNKCDLLHKKLEQGIKVAKTLSSYGKRPNEPKHVIKYIRENFKRIHKDKSPIERPFTAFPTTVTDTSSTAVTLRAVRDNVVRQHLATTQFM